MKKTVVFTLIGLVLLGLACPAMAAPESGPAQPAPALTKAAEPVTNTVAKLGACLGAGIAVVGGGWGIGRISGCTVEAIARQPEAAGQMFLAWLLPAAMIEGAMLFAMVLCLIIIVG